MSGRRRSISGWRIDTREHDTTVVDPRHIVLRTQALKLTPLSDEPHSIRLSHLDKPIEVTWCIVDASETIVAIRVRDFSTGKKARADAADVSARPGLTWRLAGNESGRVTYWIQHRARVVLVGVRPRRMDRVSSVEREAQAVLDFLQARPLPRRTKRLD